MKSEQGKVSSDEMARALGEEPLLSFTTPGSCADEFMQLLQALQIQEKRQKWPLLSTLKVQVQHCDMCSREYCSPINYRRHLRALHRANYSDEDSTKMKEWIAEFWDAISLEDAKELLSFENVKLEEVSGSSLIKALTALVRKAGFSSLPELHLKAGSQILDIIQGRPSKFPISSEQLFTVFDYASEKTFLCGSAGSMQKYVLDGDRGKIGLEAKNVIACTSFLLEQKLIDAWRAKKDAEALRIQALLLEEEEAYKKKQADELEKKRQKKKQKKRDQKEKAGRSDEKEAIDETIDNASEEIPAAETASPVASDPHVDAVVDTPTDLLFSAVEYPEDVLYDDFGMPIVDERPFIPAGSRKSRRKVLRDPQSVESTSSHKAQDSQASKRAADSQSTKAISTSKSPVAQGVQTSKAAVVPTSTASVQGSQAKLSISVSKSHEAQDSPKAISPGKSLVAQGSQASKSAVAPTSSGAPQGSQAKSYVSVTKSPEAQSSRTFALAGSTTRPPAAWGSPQSNLGSGSQSPKPYLSSSGSHAVRGSDTPKPEVSPTGSRAARGSQASSPALPKDRESRWDQRSALPSSTQWGPSAKRDVLKTGLQVESPNVPAQTKKHEVIPSPAFGGDNQAERVQKEASRKQVKTEEIPSPTTEQKVPHEAAHTKKHDAVPSVKQARWADMVQSEAARESAQVKEQEVVVPPPKLERESWEDLAERETEQEFPQLKDPTPKRKSWADIVDSEKAKESSQPKKQEVLAESVEHEAPSEPAQKKQQEAGKVSDRPTEVDQTEQRQVMSATPTKAQAHTSETSAHDELEEPEAVRSDTESPAVEFWTETFVPNGSRESDIDFESMKGNLFETMDWETAIQIAEAFQQQRWRNAIAGEHETLVLVPATEDSPVED